MHDIIYAWADALMSTMRTSKFGNQENACGAGHVIQKTQNVTRKILDNETERGETHGKLSRVKVETYKA